MQAAQASQTSSAWQSRYAQRHRLTRVTDFPAGIDPPRKVRIYRRQAHYLLQWWVPAQRRTLNERVEGDLLTAILRARQIDGDLLAPPPAADDAHTSHQELVDRFLGDVAQRVEADELAPRTLARYRSALGHYLAFVDDAVSPATKPQPAGVDRPFALGFAAFLRHRRVTPNGHPHAKPRPLGDTDYVIDVVRAMYEWAIHPHRGGLLLAGILNPFLRASLKRRRPVRDLLGEPDITLEMATDFVQACDLPTLRLVAPLIFYGLRPAETIYLFREHIDARWVTVPCIPDFNYVTKGLRDKKLPRLEVLARLWDVQPDSHGLLLLRPEVVEGRVEPPLLGHGLASLIVTYRRRSAQLKSPCRNQLDMCRDDIIADAGGLTYGHVDRGFRRVARQLAWPATATLKDFRHLFNTTLANAGMPEHERQYLMGHAPSRQAITAYTHLTQLHDRYTAIASEAFGPLIATIEHRLEPFCVRVA